MAQQSNTSVPMADVIVADGGITGLTAALGIARQRHRVLVLEKADAFTEPEPGIRLSRDTLRALDRLGVGGAVRELAVRIEELRLVDGATGDHLARVPVPAADDRDGDGCPSYAVRRRDLLAVLLAACREQPHIELRTGAAVTSYELHGERVSAVVESGERHEGDALIGAGDATSGVHRQLAGTALRIARHVFYHSAVPADRLPGEGRSHALTVWARPSWQVIQSPTGPGGYVDLCAHCDTGAGETVHGLPVGAERVIEDCVDATGSVRELLRLGEDWKMWVTRDSVPVVRWSDHRVALAGDTDHPALPFASRRTGDQAVQDAVHLGDLMDCDATDFPQAIAAYAEHRRRAAARVRDWMLFTVYNGARCDRISGPHGPR